MDTAGFPRCLQRASWGASERTTPGSQVATVGSRVDEVGVRAAEPGPRSAGRRSSVDSKLRTSAPCHAVKACPSGEDDVLPSEAHTRRSLVDRSGRRVGALRPVVFQEQVRPEVVLYHVVGGSFAACGLLAWHRRPESRAGPLMVVTGLLFFVHGTLGRLHSSLAETVGIAVSNYWIITFVALLVWFPGGAAPVDCEREIRDRRIRRG